jgi:hypothetical protein
LHEAIVARRKNAANTAYAAYASVPTLVANNAANAFVRRERSSCAANAKHAANAKPELEPVIEE